jgi:hypothetical protein
MTEFFPYKSLPASAVNFQIAVTGSSQRCAAPGTIRIPQPPPNPHSDLTVSVTLPKNWAQVLHRGEGRAAPVAVTLFINSLKVRRRNQVLLKQTPGNPTQFTGFVRLVHSDWKDTAECSVKVYRTSAAPTGARKSTRGESLPSRKGNIIAAPETIKIAFSDSSPSPGRGFPHRNESFKDSPYEWVQYYPGHITYVDLGRSEPELVINSDQSEKVKGALITESLRGITGIRAKLLSPFVSLSARWTLSVSALFAFHEQLITTKNPGDAVEGLNQLEVDIITEIAAHIYETDKPLDSFLSKEGATSESLKTFIRSRLQMIIADLTQTAKLAKTLDSLMYSGE